MTHVLLVPHSNSRESSLKLVTENSKMEHTFLFSKIFQLENKTTFIKFNHTLEFSVGMLKKCVFHYPKMAFPEFHDKWKAFPNSDRGMFSGELCSACIWKGRQFFGGNNTCSEMERKQTYQLKRSILFYSAGKLHVFRFGK